MKYIFLIIIITSTSDFVFCQNVKDKMKADSLQKLAWDSFQKNYYKKSIRLIDSSISYDNTKCWSYMIKAEAHWLINEFNEAAVSYKKAMTLNNDFLLIGANVLLGMLYDKAGNFEQAKRQYNIAVNLWEDGYVAKHKPFQTDEEVDYIKAIGLLGDSLKMRNKLTSFVQKHPEKKDLLSIADKDRMQLLEFNFKTEYSLPNNVEAKEE